MRLHLLVPLAGLAFLAGCATTSAPPAAAAPGLVSAADPRAADAGAQMLRQGGTAADAAFATLLALNVVEPQSSGIGGGAFMTWYDAAAREVREEIGTLIDAATLTHLGTFRTVAANEAGREVEGTIFTCPATVDPVPAAEIAEIRWVDPHNPADAGVDLAPLLETKVFPVLG